VFDAPWHRQSMPRCSALRTMPRQAKPVPPPTPVPIKPTEASTVLPRSLSTSPERQFIDVCSAHGVPAVAREPTTVDRPS
jgi:hypothetical protein